MMTHINYDNIDYVVGIDFGTIFSGASYAFTRDNAQRCCHITQCLKQKGFGDNQKIPTACLYDKKQQKFTRWGHDALESSSKTQQEDNMILVQNFNEQIHVILESRTGSGDNDDLFYKDATVYFLRQMIQHTRLDGVVLYVLSLPSNWSAVARNEMRQLFTECILDAEDHIEIIEQSQAAVLYCQNDKPMILAPGESYLVCDLGGETSNFESVTKGKNEEEEEEEDNENVESVISFGASHIDKKMNEYISKRIFNDDANGIAMSCSFIKHLMDVFIHSVKSTFGEAEGEAVSIPLKNEETIKPARMTSLVEVGTIAEGKLHISYEQMCTHVFDPVVDRVIAAMERIIFEKDIKAAYIITDRSSGSYYLASKIETRLEQNNIERLSNKSDEQCASMDGAVFYGLSKVNSARKNLEQNY